MAPPQTVVAWLKREYPKPTVDPEWLDACYSWIESEIKPDSVRDFDKITEQLNSQLLQSDLSASMLRGTGLPPNVSELNKVKIPGHPILVEIISMTEIGHSAFNLENLRQARTEHADLVGLEEDEENQEEGTNVPKYPRAMLRFQLSDGSTVLEAIEYRRIPELVLGETPLGFKMLLKNPFMRNGIAWLEPSNVDLKYHQTEERQALADIDFVRGLRIRMGKPVDDLVLLPEQAQPQGDDAVRAEAVQGPRERPVAWPISPPVQNRTDLPTPAIQVDEAEEVSPRKRVVAPSPSPSTTRRTKRPKPSSSKYFAGLSGSTTEERDLGRTLGLSPHRHPPLFLRDSEEPKDMEVEGGAGTHNASPDGSEEYWTAFDDIDQLPMTTDEPNAEREAADQEYWDKFDMNEIELTATLAETERERLMPKSRRATSSTIQESEEDVAHHTPAARSSQVVEAIWISDNEEKENVPAARRRPRRRANPAYVDEVIEISD